LMGTRECRFRGGVFSGGSVAEVGASRGILPPHARLPHLYSDANVRLGGTPIFPAARVRGGLRRIRGRDRERRFADGGVFVRANYVWDLQIGVYMGHWVFIVVSQFAEFGIPKI